MDQLEITKKVLEEMGVGEKPSLLVFNKLDRVEHFLLPKLVERRYIDSVAISALDFDHILRLRESIFSFFEKDMIEMQVLISYQDTWLQSQIHEYSKVIEKEYLEDGALFRIRIPKAAANFLKLEERIFS
jgi:GTP-binding protein HflX